MGSLLKLNPRAVQTGANVASVAIGAPALVYVGVGYAPKLSRKIRFAGLGCLMLWANAEALRSNYSSLAPTKSKG